MIVAEKGGKEWLLEQHKTDDGWVHIIYVEGKKTYGGVHAKRFTTKSFSEYIKDIVVLDERTPEEESEIDALLEANRSEGWGEVESGSRFLYILIGAITISLIFFILFS